MKSGFISLIGRPNAGKSTLLNQILDRKVAIISDKPQTTRNRITGIMTTAAAQFIFVDTPGIHKPKHRLGEYMVDVATGSIFDGDVVYYVVDASVPFGGGERFVLEQLKKTQSPVFLLLNKVDTLKPEEILAAITVWQSRGDFAEIVPLSALTGDNVAALLETTLDYLPEGPLYYPEDAVTDQPEVVVMAELIREKILRLTHDEIPHSIAVAIERMERPKEGKLHIHAVIYVERSSQKGIIIGKQGQLLKKIGSQARRDIEHLLGEKIYLELWVKVQDDWRNKQGMLRDLGFDPENF